jgi:GT2 family glycosyltransferase
VHRGLRLKVSVIVPTYDRLPLLKQAIESVRAQVYSDWELVIVDDGSADGTIAFIAALADARIRLVPLTHQGNVARARNAGLRVADGVYIAFLDSDDLWLPTKIGMQVAEMQRSNVRWSYTGYDLIDLEGHRVERRAGTWRPLAGEIVRQVLTTEAAVAVSTLMAERNLLDSVGHFNEAPAMNLREDYELVLRLATAAAAGVLDKPLVMIREHPGRTTHDCEDAFERTAHVYAMYLENCADPDLARIARRRRGYHLAEAAVRETSKGTYLAAARLYSTSVFSGVTMRDWFSAAKRGLANVLFRRPGTGRNRTLRQSSD